MRRGLRARWRALVLLFRDMARRRSLTGETCLTSFFCRLLSCVSGAKPQQHHGLPAGERAEVGTAGGQTGESRVCPRKTSPSVLMCTMDYKISFHGLCWAGKATLIKKRKSGQSMIIQSSPVKHVRMISYTKKTYSST